MGRSSNPSLPISTVLNKLSDDKSLQKKCTMEKIVYLFLRGISNLPDAELKQIAVKSVRLVIVFTNTTRAAVQACIDLKKKSLEKLKILRNNQISIMTAENADILSNAAGNPYLSLFELNSDLQLEASGLSTDDLFSPEVAPDLNLSEENFKLIKYIVSILSFSYLLSLNNSQANCAIDPPLDCPLSVDNRFLKQTKNVTPGTSHLNIILSPQQHRLLDENPDNVFLVGEPGTGKTAVLLAKAFYAALHEDDVEHVIISFPSEKTDFKEFIINFSETQEIPHEAKRKLKFLTLEDLSHIVEHPLQYKKLNELILFQIFD